MWTKWTVAGSYRRFLAVGAVAVAAAVLVLPGAAMARPFRARPQRLVTIDFASGPDWETFTEDPGQLQDHGRGRGQEHGHVHGPRCHHAKIDPIGFAREVCLLAGSPARCPDGAQFYDFPEGGWISDLTAIPDATWIWAPGITGATEPAELASFFFSKTFELDGCPTSGILYLSADDFAAVIVNGRVVGSVGSVDDVALAGAAQSALTAFDITSFLEPGKNVITISGQNGPPDFSPFCTDTCSYSQNPAGVVFAGSITFNQRP